MRSSAGSGIVAWTEFGSLALAVMKEFGVPQRQGQYSVAKPPFNINSGTVTRANKDFNLIQPHSFIASTWAGKESQYWQMGKSRGIPIGGVASRR
jgi:hypothetical protein